jgi:DnaJ homolog subfamily B member 4
MNSTRIKSNSRNRRRSGKFQGLIRWIFMAACLLLLLLLQTTDAKAKKDLYSVLNVPKTATEKEITKAYRKAALKYHPDKVAGPEREKAANTFKEIGHAYDILKDENKRKLYDQYGEAGLQEGFHPGFSGMGNGMGSGGSGNPFAGGNGFSSQTFSFGGPSQQGVGHGGNPFGIDLSDILHSFMSNHQGASFSGFDHFGDMNQGTARMGGGRPFQTTNKRTKPQTKEFYCSLAELSDMNGCTKKLKVTMPIMDPMTGQLRTHEKIYEIHVEPGWRDGTKVSFKETKDGVFPPITFVLKQKKHKYIQRDGDDLVYHCTVTSKQAEKGSKIKIPLPDGEILEVTTHPEEIHDNYIKKIQGKGMPIRGSKVANKTRGDFLIVFSIQEESKTSSTHHH